MEMIAAKMEHNCLSFQKIYQKSQISFSFFVKIAIEVDNFLQKSLQYCNNPKTYEA
jgi:hypothetical protein